MASTAQVRHLKVHHNPKRASLASRSIRKLSSKKSKISNSSRGKLQTAINYEKFSKYWSILSNVAAIVSVAGALSIYSLSKKKHFWQ